MCMLKLDYIILNVKNGIKFQYPSIVFLNIFGKGINELLHKNIRLYGTYTFTLKATGDFFLSLQEEIRFHPQSKTAPNFKFPVS